jgi:hypothetical protein
MRFVRHPKDFWAGILFLAFGVAAIWIARNYPIGTASRMGPGYFPRGLGALLIGMGFILSLRALKLSGTPITFGSMRPLLIVLGSVVLFGLLAPKLGIVVATLALIVASSIAAGEFRWKESVLSAILLAAFTVAAFGYGLKLQLPIWPRLLVS